MRILDKILRGKEHNDFSNLEKVLAEFNGETKYAGGQPYAEHLLELTQVPDAENQYSIKILYTNKKIEQRQKAPLDKTIEHNQERTNQFISSLESFLERTGIDARKQDFRDELRTGIELTFSADAIQLQRLTNTVCDAYADLDTSATGENLYLSNTAAPGRKFDYKYVETARDAVVRLTETLVGEGTDIQASVSGTLRQSEAQERTISITLRDPGAAAEEGLRTALGRDGISVEKKDDISEITIHASHPDNKGFGGIMRHATLALQERGIDMGSQQRER